MSIKNISLLILIPIISCYPVSGDARLRSHGSSSVGRHSDSNFLSNLFSGRNSNHHTEQAGTSASPTTPPAEPEPTSPTSSPADSRSTLPTASPANSGQTQTPATTSTASKVPDTPTKPTTASTSSKNQEPPPAAPPPTAPKTSKNKQSDCVIKTVMADDDYYACGTVPPSYTVRIWPR